MRHGPTVYNGHLREPVTLTCVVDRLPEELSYLFLRQRSVATGMRVELSTSTPPWRTDFIKNKTSADEMHIFVLINLINMS